jgi:BMFP domain-containing protein YqiC
MLPPNSSQQTVTLTRDAHSQLMARIEYLEAENRSLLESKLYL